MTSITVGVYDIDPWGVFPENNGDLYTYSGPGTPEANVTITDNGGAGGDLTLEDNDFGESATGTLTINGGTSTDVSVSAEESWTLRDTVTGQEFQMVTLHVESGGASGYYMIAEVPMIAGRTYETLSFDTTPSATAGEAVFTYSEFVCFEPGIMIATRDGNRPVEDLKPGDAVWTMDAGLQPLIWTGRRTLTFGRESHAQKPLCLRADCLGPGLPAQELRVSPQHRILLAGDAIAEVVPAGREGLAIAKALATRKGVRQMHGRRKVTYVSLLTPRHHIIFANGLAVETFYPGRYALSLLDRRDQLRLLRVFPELSNDVEGAYGPPARPLLKPRTVAGLNAVSGVGRQAGQGLRMPLTA